MSDTSPSCGLRASRLGGPEPRLLSSPALPFSPPLGPTPSTPTLGKTAPSASSHLCARRSALCPEALASVHQVSGSTGCSVCSGEERPHALWVPLSSPSAHVSQDVLRPRARKRVVKRYNPGGRDARPPKSTRSGRGGPAGQSTHGPLCRRGGVRPGTEARAGAPSGSRGDFRTLVPEPGPASKWVCGQPSAAAEPVRRGRTESFLAGPSVMQACSPHKAGHTSPQGLRGQAPSGYGPGAPLHVPPLLRRTVFFLRGPHSAQSPAAPSATHLRTQRGPGQLTDGREEAGGLLWGLSWDLLVLHPGGTSK